MNDERLQQELRALKRERQPARDLWPEIESSLSPSTDARPAWRFAAAAAVLLSVLTIFGLSEDESDVSHAALPLADLGTDAGTLIAGGLDMEYSGVLRSMAGELKAWSPASTEDPELAQSLEVLQTATQELRAALARDPDAVYLVELLEATHRKRVQVLREMALQHLAQNAHAPNDMEDLS